MTTTLTQSDIDLLPRVIEMTVEESWAFFDDKARTLLGISGEEFHRRWNAGDYAEIAGSDDHGDLMYLALLGNAR